MSPPPPPGDPPDPTNAPNLGTTTNSSGDDSSTNRRQRPLIGITTYPPNDRDRFDLPAEYVASVRRAGAEVVLIPPGISDPATLLDRLDGLVLSGGGDLDPALFGGGSHEAPDGTIEATQHESHPWLASVQWHPELTADRDPTQQRLFDALVRVAQRRI